MGCRRRFCRRPLPERLSMSARAVGPRYLRQFLAVAAAKRGSPIRPAGRYGLGEGVRAADAVAGRQETMDQIARVCL